MPESIPENPDYSKEAEIRDQEALEVKETGEKESESPYVFVGSPEWFKIKEGKEFSMTGLTYVTINCPTSCELCCVDCALNSKTKNQRTEEERTQINKVQKKMPEILATLSRLGAKQVVIIGEGEPLFEPKEAQDPNGEPGYSAIVKPLIETANQNGLGTTIFTTLTHLSAEKLDDFNKNNVSVMISLHSRNSETYRKTVIKGQPERVYNNIPRLTQSFGPPNPLVGDWVGKKSTRVGINFTVNRFNINEADEDKKWAHEQGMQFVANVKMPAGRATGEVFDYVTGTKEEFEQQKKKALELSDTKGQSSLVENFCGFGRNGLAFNTDGSMMICGYEPGLKKIMPNIVDLVKLPDKAIIEFSKIMSDRQLWETLESPCITRADEKKRAIFMKKLEEKILDFNKEYLA